MPDELDPLAPVKRAARAPALLVFREDGLRELLALLCLRAFLWLLRERY